MKVSLLTCTALAIFTGCVVPPDEPAGQPGPCFNATCLPEPTCGDGVCAPGESFMCPSDCAITPAPVCPQAIDLPRQVPVDVPGSTTGAASAPDPASCGGGVVGPQRVYDFHALAAGRYQISVTAPFAAVLDVQLGTCKGAELACSVSSAPVTVSLVTGQSSAITIAGVGSASGTYVLHIEKEPDACGDDVCEAGETSSSCPADCSTSTGTGTSASTCGDGICSADETSGSCPVDCDSNSLSGGDGTTGGGTTTDTGSGDGSTSDGSDDGTVDDGSDDGSDDGDDGSDDGDDGGDDGGDEGDDGADSGIPHPRHGQQIHHVTAQPASAARAPENVLGEHAPSNNQR